MAAPFSVENGAGDVPVVLLHGFGGNHSAWNEIVARIGGARRTIAVDLPGHGRSLALPHGSAAVAARAILSHLSESGLGKAHFVGHSFGGATAALASLMEPARVASLTLLAPGGFGPEINHRLLRRYASATEESEIALLLEQFFGRQAPVPMGLAAEQARNRAAPGAVAALERIVATFFEGDRQKVLPLDELARLGVPVKVLWGGQDGVLPARQTHELPSSIAVHIVEGVGHMLPHESPEEAAHLILENSARAG